MFGQHISRRSFLRLALLSGIALGSGVIYNATKDVGFPLWFRWMARGQVARRFAPKARVGLGQCNAYDADLVERLWSAWQNARMPDLQGMRVVLKPNLVDVMDGRPTSTDVRFVRGMVRMVRDMGAQDVTIAEGPAFRRDTQAILDATGFAAMMGEEKVDFVDLNYDDLVEIPVKSGYTRLERLLIGRTISDADFVVSLPKLKTHHWATLSASIKNLFGTVPGIKYGWPKNTLHIRGIPASLVELVDSFPTRLGAVVDGVVAMEGDGPLFGTAVPAGVIVAGTDLVAVDATCARLIGLVPQEIDYLEFAEWAGVGTIDAGKIDLVGDSLERLQRHFERAPT